MEERLPSSNAHTDSLTSREQASSKRNQEKRIRVTQACDQCREVKRKCDVATPCCSPCATQGQSCTYARNTKRRGTQPGYLRALETALAWILEDVPGSQESLQRLLGEAGVVGEIRQDERMGALRLRWRDSQLFEDMSVVLKSEEWQGVSMGGRPGGTGGAASDMDEITASVTYDSEEEGGRQWPIL